MEHKKQVIIDAYNEKVKVKEAYEKARNLEKNRKIRPLSPVSHHPDLNSTITSTNNSVACLGSSIHVPQTVPAWWKKEPTIAGEALTKVQKKLSSPQSFTGMYKKRFEPDDPKSNPFPVSGDIVVNPKRAMRLLRQTPTKDLTIPRRACDFRSEVEWRLSLRDVESH